MGTPSRRGIRKSDGALDVIVNPARTLHCAADGRLVS
jgi:hypothetical protein